MDGITSPRIIIINNNNNLRKRRWVRLIGTSARNTCSKILNDNNIEDQKQDREKRM